MNPKQILGLIAFAAFMGWTVTVAVIANNHGVKTERLAQQNAAAEQLEKANEEIADLKIFYDKRLREIRNAKDYSDTVDGVISDTLERLHERNRRE